jgi:hypothetical protein
MFSDNEDIDDTKTKTTESEVETKAVAKKQEPVEEIDFEPRPQDVVMWSLVHAHHPGNQYYAKLLDEINDLPEKVDAAASHKGSLLVDRIINEHKGRFLQLVMGSLAAGTLHEPSRRCRIMSRADAIQKVSQELMWLKYKKATSAAKLQQQQAAAAAAASIAVVPGTAPLKLPPKGRLGLATNGDIKSKILPKKIKTASELSMKPGQLALLAAEEQEEQQRVQELLAGSESAATAGGPSGPPLIKRNKATFRRAPNANPRHHGQPQPSNSQYYNRNATPASPGQRYLQYHQKPAPQPTQQRPRKQHQPWLRVHQEQIEEAIPKDASCVVHIFDRRVNLDAHAADASMYSLLRSWAQDDPYRKIQVELPTSSSSSSSNDSGDRTAGKRSATAMMSTTTMKKPSQPPTRNVMADIGTLDDAPDLKISQMENEETKGEKEEETSKNTQDDDRKDTNIADKNPLQQLVAKAKSIKRLKQGVHKARVDAALLRLERRGIHLSN